MSSTKKFVFQKGVLLPPHRAKAAGRIRKEGVAERSESEYRAAGGSPTSANRLCSFLLRCPVCALASVRLRCTQTAATRSPPSSRHWRRSGRSPCGGSLVRFLTRQEMNSTFVTALQISTISHIRQKPPPFASSKSPPSVSSKSPQNRYIV